MGLSAPPAACLSADSTGRRRPSPTPRGMPTSPARVFSVPV